MGTYIIKVTHKTLGLLDNQGGDFDVSSTVTAINTN
jgi:hypothetical protein